MSKIAEDDVVLYVIFYPDESEFGAYERLVSVEPNQRSEFIRMVASYALVIQPLMSLIRLEDDEKTVVYAGTRSDLVNSISGNERAEEDYREMIRSKVRIPKSVYPELYHDLKNSSIKQSRLKNLFSIGIAIRDILEVAVNPVATRGVVSKNKEGAYSQSSFESTVANDGKGCNPSSENESKKDTLEHQAAPKSEGVDHPLENSKYNPSDREAKNSHLEKTSSHSNNEKEESFSSTEDTKKGEGGTGERNKKASVLTGIKM